MRFIGVICYILADDVLIIASGKNALALFRNALNLTHAYLKAMGARIAPDKNYNFANRPIAVNWLSQTTWDEIGEKIEVVRDFRYLGAHITDGDSIRRSTLENRWGKLSSNSGNLSTHLPPSKRK